MEKDQNTMLQSLFKFRTVFICLAICLSIVLLLHPTQAQAAGNLNVTVKSPTNPDHIFTGDEVFDLTIYLQGNAGETYSVSYKVIDSRKLTLMQTREPITVILSGDGCGELVPDLSAIKGRDNFRLEVTVTNDSGDLVAQTSCAFGRVNLDSVLSQVANSRDGILISTDETRPERYLYLKKQDRFPETLWISYRIVSDNGQLLRQVQGWVNVPSEDYYALPLNFYGLDQYGQCKIFYYVHDDSGNLRANGAAYFHHYGTEYIDGALTSARNKDGLIFFNDEPYDLTLSLRKTDSIPEDLSISYAITDVYGAVVKEYSGELSLPAEEAVTLPLDLSDVTGYGTFDLTITFTDKYGNQKTRVFSFSRALSTAKPGDVPLVNINVHFTANRGDPTIKLDLSAKAGFAMWRCSVPWTSVETSRGKFAMPDSVEQVMQKTESLGMEPLILLAYGNDVLYGLSDPTKPGWLEAYANYCKYVASYFGDRVTYYEIWNEWNHTTMGKTDPNRRDGRYYAMALAAASEAIKSVNPNAVIIGGAMAGHSEDWMVDMLNYDGNGDGKSDAMEAMDGFSFHSYATDWKTCFYSFTEYNYARDFQEVLEVLNRYGDASSKEIWMTETGWSTCIGPGVTEEEQAAYLVQLYTWALTVPDQVDRIFWYDFMNGRDAQTLKWDPTHGEQNCGLIHSWTNTGEEPLAYSAKKGYVAACAMNSILAGATDGVAYDLGEGVYAYKFQKNGQDLVVVWMDNTTKTLSVSFSGDLTVTDLYGNATIYTGTAQLNLSNSPIYIQGDLSGLTLN